MPLQNTTTQDSSQLCSISHAAASIPSSPPLQCITHLFLSNFLSPKFILLSQGSALSGISCKSASHLDQGNRQTSFRSLPFPSQLQISSLLATSALEQPTCFSFLSFWIIISSGSHRSSTQIFLTPSCDIILILSFSRCYLGKLQPNAKSEMQILCQHLRRCEVFSINIINLQLCCNMLSRQRSESHFTLCKEWTEVNTNSRRKFQIEYQVHIFTQSINSSLKKEIYTLI